MRTVAALYIDPRGPYPKMPGVECWDETRDARTYAGPHPVVAHPPCGPWGRLKALCKKQDPTLGPIAVDQVRTYGGVLEHPADSGLFRHCGLPRPGELPDEFGGITVAVNQCDWGHKCRKPTWLYLVGVSASAIPRVPSREPTHGIFYGEFERSGHAGPKLTPASKEIRRRTPPAFADLLVELARASGTGTPTHAVCNGRGKELIDGTIRQRATAAEARLTPPPFASLLVRIARSS